MDLLRNCLVIFLASFLYVNSQSPKVYSKLGEIIGKEITVPLEQSNKKVQQYLGIPFAKPPVGDLRFRKPQAVMSLSSPFYAHNFSAICPQLPTRDLMNYTQNEDCLYLNVYVPDQPSEIPGGHAVMIWIYGGSFQYGAASLFDFSTLSAFGNIIVVTFNYRVGVFGFLSSSDENAPGNYGLWDQHLAFKWVHDNIGDFGGNNEKVTIAGVSAGAMSVTQQALFPGNRGLFQRIIAQSGSMSVPGLGLSRVRTEDVHVLAESTGCKKDNMFDIIECLRTKDVSDLLGTAILFTPTVDGELMKEDTKNIAKISESKLLDELEFFRSLDMMSGFNANEGVFVFPMIMYFLPEKLQAFQFEDLNITYYNWKNYYIPAVMSFTFRSQFAHEIIQLVEAQYTPWQTPYDYQLLRLQFEKLVGDLTFAIPAIQMARLHAISSSKNNFMYHFAPKPSVRTRPVPTWIPGAGHAEEIMFLLGAFDILGVGEQNSWENDLINKMMTYWTNFIKSGNPNSPSKVTPAWEQYSAEVGEYMLLDKTMTDKPDSRHYYAEEANFWLHVFPDLVDAVSVENTGNCGDETITNAATNLQFVNWAVLFALSLYLCVC